MRWAIIGSLLVAGGLGSYAIWRVDYRAANVARAPLYIGTGSGFAAVRDSLHRLGLRDSAAFGWLARHREYPTHIRPGRYRLAPEMGNLALLRYLETGPQDTVLFTLKPFQYLETLPRQVSRQLEADSFKLELLLNGNAHLLRRYGLDTCTIRTLFIPGRYRLLWNTSATAYLDTVAAIHRRFWTAARQAQADSLHLSPTQVSVLASIVQRETAEPTDRPRIAAVYLNRLRLGQPLQADPTLLWPLHGPGHPQARAERGQKSSFALQHLPPQGPAARPHHHALPQRP